MENNEHVVICSQLKDFLVGCASLIMRQSQQQFYIPVLDHNIFNPGFQKQAMDDLASRFYKHRFTFYKGKKLTQKSILSMGPTVQVYVPSVLSTNKRLVELNQLYKRVASHSYTVDHSLVHGAVRLDKSRVLDGLVHVPTNDPIYYLERIVPIDYDVPNYKAINYGQLTLFLGMVGPHTYKNHIYEACEAHKNNTDKLVAKLIEVTSSTDFYLHIKPERGTTLVIDPRKTNV